MFIRCACLLLFAASVGCGSSLSDNDVKSVTDASRGESAIQKICAPGGECKASQVRSIEQSNYCNLASMLARYGQPVPANPGVTCPPQ